MRALGFSRWMVTFLLISSCAMHAATGAQLSLEELASSNQAKLLHLSLGMSKADVISQMGADTADTHDGVVNNPWTVEAFSGKDGASYEVLYYVTRKNPPFRPVSKSLATPILLKDGKVVGWGSSALDRLTGGGTAP